MPDELGHTGAATDPAAVTIHYHSDRDGYIYIGESFGNIGLSSPNTGEVYGALTFGPVTGKVSVSVRT